MPRMGKTEEDWNGLKLGFLKTVQPNSFQSWFLLLATSKIMLRRHIVCHGSLILSFTCNSFAYFKFHSDWGRVIGKIKLNCRDIAPLTDICFIRTSHYYRQSLGKALKFSLNSTHLIQTPINADNGHLFLAQSTDSHSKLTSKTLHYQLCVIILIDLSFLKVKKPSFDSMLMFPALQYTG